MTAWAYYRKERQEITENKRLTEAEAEIVVKKLTRHFKLGEVDLDFTSGNRYSRGGRWKITINLNQLDFHTICHELAHTYQLKRLGFKSGDRWHTKKHLRIVKRMMHYCQKKNWFEQELNKRLTPKPLKPELTKEELKQQKIQRTKDNIRAWESKLKRAENRLKKLKRQLVRFEKASQKTD
jgi:hypothetical protein